MRGRGPLQPKALARVLDASVRMVREGLQALATAGLAIEARQGGWIPGRDPSRITLAQVRAAARSTLRYPQQEADHVSEAVARAFAQAEGAAESALGESLDSFLRRIEATPAPIQPVQQPTPEPVVRPLGVGQGAHKPA